MTAHEPANDFTAHIHVSACMCQGAARAVTCVAASCYVPSWSCSCRLRNLHHFRSCLPMRCLVPLTPATALFSCAGVFSSRPHHNQHDTMAGEPSMVKAMAACTSLVTGCISRHANSTSLKVSRSTNQTQKHCCAFSTNITHCPAHHSCATAKTAAAGCWSIAQSARTCVHCK